MSSSQIQVKYLNLFAAADFCSCTFEGTKEEMALHMNECKFEGLKVLMMMDGFSLTVFFKGLFDTYR